MPLSGDALRTAEIDIDGVNFILDHFGSSDHGLGIIAAELCDKRTIFGTGGEMLLLVVFGGGHHFGVEHGSVGQGGPVATCEQAEGELGLFHHGGADEERVSEPGQVLLVVGLYLHL